jgi:hypothetical protein
MEALMDDTDRPTEVTKTEARQGIRVHAIRQVLIFGTVGAVLALLIAGLVMS